MKSASTSYLGAVVVGLLLGGCGVFEPLRPLTLNVGDLPHHSEHPLFRLSWDCRHVDGGVRIVGILQVKEISDVAKVILEVRGLDGAGREVSKRWFRVEPLQPLSKGESWPFEVRFTPSAKAAHYSLDIWTYDIGVTGNGNGMGGGAD